MAKLTDPMGEAYTNAGEYSLPRVSLWSKDKRDALTRAGTYSSATLDPTQLAARPTPDWNNPNPTGTGRAAARYGGASGGASGAFDIGSAYDQSIAKYKEALDAAYKSYEAENQAQAGKLADQYNAARGGVYTNARLSAIGNNERLASLGLAGNLYDQAQSGVSETSRLSADVGMRNDINLMTNQEQAARDQLALELLQQGYARDEEYAKYLAETMIAKANAQYQAQQDEFNNNLAMQEYLLKAQAANEQRSSGGAHPVNPTVDATPPDATPPSNVGKNVLYDSLALLGTAGRGYSAAEQATNDAYVSGLISPSEYLDIQKRLAEDAAISGKGNTSKTKWERMNY